MSITRKDFLAQALGVPIESAVAVRDGATEDLSRPALFAITLDGALSAERTLVLKEALAPYEREFNCNFQPGVTVQMVAGKR